VEPQIKANLIHSAAVKANIGNILNLVGGSSAAVGVFAATADAPVNYALRVHNDAKMRN